MSKQTEISIVRVEQIEKNYDRIRAVKGISFDIKEGEFYTLLGPSGCGKTTTLRSLAGLERIDSGQIYINEQLVDDGRIFVPPYQRPIGMVFQSYAIWPHMTVAGNVAFPLKNEKKYTSKVIIKMVDDALELVQLTGLAKRPAPNLSGGQQQRLALARALVSAPTVLLLDEPLSNLDAKLREEMRLELKNLTRRLKITTFYVTHDQVEALVLSDRIALMRDGKIIEEGKQYDMYMYPKHSFTADFFGINNIFEATILSINKDKGIALIELTSGHKITAPSRDFEIATGQKVKVAIRPENIFFDKASSIDMLLDFRKENVNKIEAQVKEMIFLGDYIDYRFAANNTIVRVRAHPEVLLPENASVMLLFMPKHVCILMS